MNFTIEIEQEEDGRWLAEVIGMPGVLAYGEMREEAVAKVQALALRVLADKLEHKEVMPELANFIEYLQFKVSSTPALKKDEPEESNFLMSIAGLGESEETGLSERDEEILKSEIDSVRGFSHLGYKQ
ncbi:type II toxin-antitoxin system HicB family antitoxin [Aerosakkonemataceae cyanobacterium BLCC-F50]|uniref:Type II toxin-antitoxin system HicB family antitoxin n=1 Tax=Floridaenema flaviceps BLCC-F50 TaxID=3153642 RepID=A0ABV4XXT2_9CYAN